ncbi:MAG: hypothetical protein ACJAUV_000268 [Flavobacteriales bacterium]|jgi:hypothetical protein
MKKHERRKVNPDNNRESEGLFLMLNFKWLMLNGLIKLGSLKINPDTNRESEGLLVIFNVEF